MDPYREVKMIELFEQDVRTEGRQSSKGNQTKWENNGIWYKGDYTGYEGLTEYVVSRLLGYTELKPQEYVVYDTEEIRYKRQIYRGCKSRNFLPEGCSLITLERLFENCCGVGLNKCIYRIRDHKERLRFLVEQTERYTGLTDFGGYMSKLLTVDTLFLNEDRHTHNIAVLRDRQGEYQYCPIFDNGAGLLADTTMDYPLSANLEELIEEARPKTFCQSFDEQLDIAEELYGQKLHFFCGKKEIEAILDEEAYYPAEIRQRVRELLLLRYRKYRYLFQE